MEYTQKSISIKNDPMYTFRLRLNDIKGIIRLTQQDDQRETIRITDRSIPIVTDIKWQFHRERTGYSEGEMGFIGSYISRDSNPDTYLKWKTYIVNQYKKYKQKEKLV